ncbi:MAG: aquaporin [Actinomycetota bacterium]|nr:aquaporin [Actinomycetota bacterium]
MSINKLAAELLGTYVLVLGGTATILSTASAAGVDQVPAGATKLVIVAFGFGLALMAGLYAFGEVSGGHFNPAVSLAMVLDKRLDPLSMAGYWVAQLVGATLASLTLLVATSTEAVASTMTTFGAGIEAWEAFLFEVVFTAIFLAVILKVTTSENSGKTAFLGIGLTLTMIHLVLIPFTGTSVNPVRSLGPGIVGGVWADQWVYWIAPLVGAALGWGLYKLVTSGDTE